MTLSMTIANFASALDATRAELDGINVEIDKRQSERQRVLSAPPHTDDIVAVLKRGVVVAEQEFRLEMRDFLNGTFVGPNTAVAAAPGRAVELLRVEGNKPDRETLITRAARGQSKPNLNIGALAYLLRDRIEAEIPSLVAKLCPAAQDGMQQADRDAAVNALDGEIATLTAERDRLQADLFAARQAANGRH